MPEDGEISTPADRRRNGDSTRRRRSRSPSHHRTDRHGQIHRRSHRSRSRQRYQSRHSSRSRSRRRRRHSRSPPSRHRSPSPKRSKTEENNSPEEDVEDFELTVPDDDEHLIAERRRKRAEILSKYQHQQQEQQTARNDSAMVSDAQGPVAPAVNAVHSVADNDAAQSVMDVNDGDGELAAADFDLDADERNNEDERKHREAILAKVSRHAHELDQQQPGQQRTELLPDLFAEADDLFAPADLVSLGATTSSQVKPSAIDSAPELIRTAHNPATLHDNWDDTDGYYLIILGELLHERYQVYSNLGRGVFSAVVKARDTSNSTDVAIKMIRNNHVMYKAGQKELSILQRLQESDPTGRKHVVRFLDHFEHRGHLCIVFESMSMNLREVLKKYGVNKGLNIKAVRAYAQQLFWSLSLLRKCNIIHADIKPDNMLVNEAKNIIKLADLGSASDASENDITPYLVSRFYRAPEIMLGLPYDFAIDVWSVACTLYELYTGKILFPGRSNNQMLKLIMDCKGRFPFKLLRRGQFAADHFELGNEATVMFLEHTVDNVTQRDKIRTVPIPAKPDRDLRSRLMSDSVRRRIAQLPTAEEDWKLLSSFVDFLEKCLTLNPEKRLTVKDALAHPFISSSAQQ